MSASTIDEVAYTLLARRADEAARDLDYPIAMPNVDFEPPTSGGPRLPYLSMTFMPNGSELDGLPFDGDVTNIGLMQISVFWPSGQGLVKPTQAASKVAQYFLPGLVIRQGDVELRIDRRPSIAPSIQESDLVQVPVTIRWRASASQ